MKNKRELKWKGERGKGERQSRVIFQTLAATEKRKRVKWKGEKGKDSLGLFLTYGLFDFLHSDPMTQGKKVKK